MNKPPAVFNIVKKDNPEMEFVTQDPVTGESTKNGQLWWDQVKTQNLPSTKFVHEKMEEYVKKSSLAQHGQDHERQIYVLANSWVYLLTKDGEKPGSRDIDCTDTEKLNNFINVIKEIRNNNRGKEVYIVIGDMEADAMYQHHELNRVGSIYMVATALGMKLLPLADLRKMGYTNEARLEQLEGKIWKLDTNDTDDFIFQ